jgi:hypothetical protein
MAVAVDPAFAGTLAGEIDADDYAIPDRLVPGNS